VEGYVERPHLIELVETHRYGIHGRSHEHFGISIAELVAGGAIPFVPSGGGQVEIVDRTPHLVYESIQDAVRKIGAVVADTALQEELRSMLWENRTRFSTVRFHDEIRRTVVGLLEQRLSSK
jgi:hypothetical protein